MGLLGRQEHNRSATTACAGRDSNPQNSGSKPERCTVSLPARSGDGTRTRLRLLMRQASSPELSPQHPERESNPRTTMVRSHVLCPLSYQGVHSVGIEPTWNRV